MARLGALSIALVLASSALASADDQPSPGGEVDMGDPQQPDQPPQPEQPVKDPKVAKKWLGAAQQLVQRGDALAKSKPDDAKAQYENAVTAYQKAIEAGDDITVYLQLAAVEEKLGDVPAAIHAYAAVTKPDAGAKPDVVKKAQAKIDPLMTKVGTVTLVIAPDDATIEIDGKEVGKAPLKEPLILMPGTYKLTLSLTGYQTKDDVELKVEAGSESERKLELDPNPITPTKPVGPEEPTPVAEAPKPPDKMPLYIGAGATGALFLGTVVTGILAVHQHSVFVAPGTSTDDRLDAQDNGRRLAIASDVLLGTTVLAAGATAYYYFFKYKKPQTKPQDDSHNPNAPKIDFVPWVQPTGGGFAALGTF